jgi:hypothetical protein
MKIFLLIAALVLQAPVSQGPRGSVTGRVIAAGTSEGVADADVAIVTPEGVLETTTDTTGRYDFSNVPSGRQTVVVRADGFFVEPIAPNTTFSSRMEVPVTVSAGTTPVAVPNVSMVRGGTITGKVVDPQGHPMPFVRVQAFRPDAAAMNSGVVPDSGSRATDDRGEYRMFFVPPGEYVVRAQIQRGDAGPSPVAGPGAGPAPTGPREAQILLSTLFPSTTDLAQAGKVVVKSGEEVRGIDISVRMEVVTLQPPAPKPTGGYKISGVVVDDVLPWVGGASLLLGSATESGPPRQAGGVIIGGTPGAFEIPNVLPGKYDLFAGMGNGAGSPGPGGETTAWGRATVEVVDHDVDNVRFMLHPSQDVSGVVKIDGKPAPEGGTLKVGLSPTGAASRIPNYRGILDRTQSPDANGKVTIARAADGNYQVFVQGADNLYLADVRQGDVSILTTGIDVRNAVPAPFEMLLSSDGGIIEGVVSRTDKSPMAGATVLLIPADRQLMSMSKTATAGADGKYTFRGVRPGEYKVFGGPPNALPTGGITTEVLSSIESRGASVSVKAGNDVRLDVEAITN